MKIVVDVSYYNNLSNAQWELLAGEVEGVIIRLSFGLSEDSKASVHISNAKRVGLPFAGYHWVDPTRDFSSQINFYKSMVAKYSPASMFNDYEQYWSDWGAYLRQDLSTAYATRFSASQLNSYYSRFHEAAQSGISIPVGSYSAEWFISKYAPLMTSWIYKLNYWDARYFRYYDNVWWLAKQKDLGKNFNISKVEEIANYAKIVNGIGRQFESYLEIDGLGENIGYHLDWNVFTDEGYYRMFGVEPKEPEQPPQEEENTFVVVSQQVGSQALRLRSEPSTSGSVIAGEVAGTKLQLDEDPKLALTKIGVMSQWLKVIDPQDRHGFVAAWFVELVPPEPKEPEGQPEIKDLIVIVTPDVGSMGLRLRAQPNTSSATITGLAVGTRLKVLEPTETALPKIGVTNQWLNVTPPNGLVGYVAAWYVKKEETPPVPETKVEIPQEAEILPGVIEQKYRVIASALWVRDKPDGNKIGYLWKDEIITVTEIADKWAYCEKGWVYMTYIVPV